MSHNGSNHRRAEFYGTEIQKLFPRYNKVLIPEVNMLKNSSTLAVSVPINISTNWGFVFVNGYGNFVDALRKSILLAVYGAY